MGINSINSQLDELIKYIGEVLSPEGVRSFTDDEANKLVSSVRAYLIDCPGELIYEQNKQTVKARMTAIDLMWKMFDDDEHYEEIFFGDNVDFITNFASDYIKRARMMRPLFISTRKHIGKEFEFYFQEATRAWLHGCDQAVIIICNSLLEELLRAKLCDVDVKYAHKLIDGWSLKSNPDYGMNALKNFAKDEGILPKELIEKLTSIQKVRNDIVHNLNVVTDEEAYTIISDTKTIVEYLLNN